VWRLHLVGRRQPRLAGEASACLSLLPLTLCLRTSNRHRLTAHEKRIVFAISPTEHPTARLRSPKWVSDRRTPARRLPGHREDLTSSIVGMPGSAERAQTVTRPSPSYSRALPLAARHDHHQDQRFLGRLVGAAGRCPGRGDPQGHGWPVVQGLAPGWSKAARNDELAGRSRTAASDGFQQTRSSSAPASPPDGAVDSGRQIAEKRR